MSVRRQIQTLNVHKSANRGRLAQGFRDGCFGIWFTKGEEEYLGSADVDPFDPRPVLSGSLFAD